MARPFRRTMPRPRGKLRRSSPGWSPTYSRSTDRYCVYGLDIDMDVKVCIGCRHEKPLEDFTKHPRMKSGRQSRCRECTRNGRRDKANNNRGKGLCFCGEKPAPNSKLCLFHQDKASHYHRNYMKDPVKKSALQKRNRELQQQLKLETFDAYGGRSCSCCGEHRIEFLSIDHIQGSPRRGSRLGVKNGEGQFKAPPRQATNRTGGGLYRWLKKNSYPKGFRVLCMNCNFAHGHAGYCPHELERQAVSA